MDIILTIFSLVILLFSVIAHELAHGYVAYSLGDPTAKYAGRLTLNPLKHLDIFGSILLPLLLFITQSALPLSQRFLFGWAKPVPVNPNNFRGQKYGEIKVSLAGPMSNILLAIIFGLALRFMPQSLIFMSNGDVSGIGIALSRIVSINIWLAIFNLIPIPPLDGSWILFNLLPPGTERFKIFFQQYGFIILMFLILSGGIEVFGYLSAFLFHIITGS